VLNAKNLGVSSGRCRYSWKTWRAAMLPEVVLQR
jgi:hypothetical protein